MMKIVRVLVIAVAMAPTLASTQGLLATLDQVIYRAQSYRNVIESGECSCATRFPSWDRSVQRFNDNYLGADRNGLRDARNEYRAQANEMREAVKELCEDAENW